MKKLLLLSLLTVTVSGLVSGYKVLGLLAEITMRHVPVSYFIGALWILLVLAIAAVMFKKAEECNAEMEDTFRPGDQPLALAKSLPY
jgi:hypothetical protein